MKKTLLLFLICAGFAYSQTVYLNVWSNGKVTSIPIADIQKLTFSNTQSAVANKDATTLIQSFKLLQNYPNPFNPTTTIEYQIPEGGDVEIQIFSIHGEIVRSFKNSHISSGSFNVVWDGKNNAGNTVASGLYIYKVSFENSIIAKRMTFIK